MKRQLLRLGTCTLLLGLLTNVAVAADKLPETTKDGLHLVKQHELGAVYMKPGASLEPYNQILLVDTYVAFAKNWQRDHNREEIGLANRVSDSDMERIKKEVAKDFNKVFTKELEKGGYKIATEVGQDVLTLRPAIINLEITAPDVGAGFTRTMVREEGQLTLYAELYDSVTSEKFAEVIDAEVAGDHGFAEVANRVTNRHALDEVLEDWADLLRKRLDEAHGKN